MPRTNTVIIGAGHAGLAMSRCLADRGVPHVVLDRGCVGERWRTARWDSFRMLTPNWLSRLPGWTYDGPEPDGFMTADDFVDYLSRYAWSFDAPVRSNTLVTRVERVATGFAVHTDRGVLAACNVVVATGYHSRAKVPDLATGLAPDVAQLTTSAYRSPSSLPDGGVLVVGASASGVQIATSSPAPAGGCSSPWEATTDCPAAIGTATSRGGSTGSVRSTGPSTNTQTPIGPWPSRRCNLPAHRTDGGSTSESCTRPALN